LVLDHEGDYPSRWAACQSVSATIGCSGQLFDWVKKAEAEERFYAMLEQPAMAA